jgi:hypothetical protein
MLCRYERYRERLRERERESERERERERDETYLIYERRCFPVGL